MVDAITASLLRAEPWTRDDLEGLPKDFRYEIVGGRLLVSPKPGRRHQLARSEATFPERVRLTVEVISPSSRVDDRVRKPAEHAAVGIPFYWLIELDPSP